MNVAELTFPALTSLHAHERGSTIALSFEGRKTSFRELERNSTRLAGALSQAGLAHGARVAYCAKNSDRFFEIMIGAAKAGCVLVPIGWRLAPPEVKFIIENAEIGLIFVDRDTFAACRSITADLTGLTIISIDSVSGTAEYEAFRDSVDAYAGALPAPAPDDVFLQLYTSGTTGRPKGAMIAHRNFFGLRQRGAGTGCDFDDWREGDVGLVAIPLSHVGGAGWGMLGLFNGVTTVIARDFDPAAILDHIERDGVNRIILVPSALQIMLGLPGVRDRDYSRLAAIAYGAAPMPLGLLKEAIAVFGNVFTQLYGMTEATGSVTYLPPSDHRPEGSQRMASAGIAIPGIEIRIADAGGATLGVETVGEVLLRGPSIVAGYWRAPEATAATFAADGWLHTGDAGYLDADGYLYIRDRLKDMIISGGENVYPAEVENALLDHPGVADAAVIGVPSQTWGEAVHAAVVVREGARPSEDDLIAFVQARLARFKAPRSVAYVKALPRNAAGKVLRGEVRANYHSAQAMAAEITLSDAN